MYSINSDSYLNMDSLILSSALPRFSRSNLSPKRLIYNSRPTKIINCTKYSFIPTFPKKLKSNVNLPAHQLQTSKRAEEIKKNHYSFLASVFKAVDDFICSFMDPPLHPSVDPKRVLSGTFLPVPDELPPTPCQVVEGALPACLDGVYIRNGPNPQFVPHGPHHLFDGDGMLHGVTISQGRATFCSRFVRTYKFLVERNAGHTVFPSPFSSFSGVGPTVARVALSLARAAFGQFDPIEHGFGLANTSLAFIGGKLYALGESDLPYEVRATTDGDLITLERHDFDHRSSGDQPFISMTAHPKVDPITGETFGFRYHVVPPLLTFFRINLKGRKQPDVPIFSMKSTALMHDFAITENYAVFNDGQMVMSPFEIFRGRPPMSVDRSKVPRIGVIERYAEDERGMWWVDAPGFNMSHVVNAWEEDGGDTVVLVASNFASVENALQNMDMAELRMEKIRISVKEKKVVARRQLSDKLLDLPVVNPTYVGRKNRYAYAAIAVPPMTIIGVVKVDLSSSSDDCVVATHLYEQGCTGNEPYFVANNSDGDEDDGYLVTYVHDEIKQESKFLVMDAKSPTLEIVAAVKLPGRVPCGFHGLFVSEKNLNKM